MKPGIWTTLFRLMPAATVLAMIAGIVLLLITLDSPIGETFAFRGFQASLAAVYTGVGAVIMSRRPGHAVGRLLSVIGLLASIDLLLNFFSVYTVQQSPGALPGGLVAAWLANFLWIWLAILAGPVLFVLYPSGTLQSRRWITSIVLAVLAALGFSVSLAFRPGPLDASPLIDNRFGVEGITGWLDAAAAIGIAALVGSSLIAFLSLAIRMRRSRGVERLQLKWISFASIVLVIGFFLYPATEPLNSSTVAKINEIVVLLALLGIPLAVGVAILRYRLYEIDRIINRAVVYAALTVCLALTYIVVVVALGGTVRALTGESSGIVTAVSTLVVAALFQPLRTGIQSGVDHRFYRRKYDAANTLDAFSAHLRDEIDLTSMRGELQAAVIQAMQPAHVSIWLRPPGQPHER